MRYESAQRSEEGRAQRWKMITTCTELDRRRIDYKGSYPSDYTNKLLSLKEEFCVRPG